MKLLEINPIEWSRFDALKAFNKVKLKEKLFCGVIQISTTVMRIRLCNGGGRIVSVWDSVLVLFVICASNKLSFKSVFKKIYFVWVKYFFDGSVHITHNKCLLC